MNYTTRALFLKSTRYGERGLILRFYTEQQGLKSYATQQHLGRHKGLKRSVFSPLSLHQLEAASARRGNLHYLRSTQLECSFLTAHPAKVAIVFFLTELLNQVLKEAEANAPLFDYLVERIQFLKTSAQHADFHLHFLFSLTQYLGFYPNLQDSPTPYFNLQEGVYTREGSESHCLTGESLVLFQALSQRDEMRFESGFKREQRKRLLDILEWYYRLHLEGFKPFESRTVLEQLFD